MIRKYKYILLPSFYLLDLLILNLVYLITFRYLFSVDISVNPVYVDLLIVANVIWAIFSFVFHAYREKRGRNFSWHLNRIFVTQIGFLLGLLGFIVLTKNYGISRSFLGSFIGMQFTAILITHMLRHYMMVKYRSTGHNYKGILVLGKEEENQAMQEWSENNPRFGYRIKNSINCLQGDCITQLANAVNVEDYDELLILAPELLGNEIDRIVDTAEDNGLRVLVAPNYVKSFGNRAIMDQMNGTPVIRVRREPLKVPFNRVIKRSFDLFFSTLVVVLFYWWIHALVGALIKLTSRGPVIFKQKRIGVDSKEFECLKFRTMTQDSSSHKNAEKGYGKITQKNDSRVTWIGKILRKTNLDELPQFLNVLLGDMSVVGPRPHMLAEDLVIREQISKYRIRQFVQPGITGWAQVNGYRGGTTDLEKMQKRIQYDIWYIEHWDLILDIKIVFRTFVQMVTLKTGAH